MSPQVMNSLYFVVIGICALVMILSPQTFMGRAKYDEGAVKTQGFIKKAGIGLLIFSVVLIIYFLFFK